MNKKMPEVDDCEQIGCICLLNHLFLFSRRVLECQVFSVLP